MTSTEHGVNVPLLRKTLEHITAHPEEWEQGEWIAKTPCGTVACIAGWAAIEAGYEPRWFNDQTHTALVDGGLVPLLAGRELGLHMTWSSHPLFHADNTLADVWRIASEITHGEIEVPADLPGGAS